MSDFNDALDAVCERCGEQAQYHRLTVNSRLYCLVLNSIGQDKLYGGWTAQGVRDRERTYAAQVTVKWLERSPLSEQVGIDINAVLRATK